MRLRKLCNKYIILIWYEFSILLLKKHFLKRYTYLLILEILINTILNKNIIKDNFNENILNHNKSNVRYESIQAKI